MKQILVAIVLATALNVHAAEAPSRVIDGDTVEFQVDWLPPALGNKIKVRVFGVDTPEKAPRAQCPDENLKAIAASNFTKRFVSMGSVVTAEYKSWDKYGGRVLGDVIVDGKSLREALIESGHARPYFGDKKKTWCN